MREDIKSNMLQLKRVLVDSCKACDGSGYLPPEINGDINPCQCMRIFHYLNELLLAEIPKDYWWLSLDSLKVNSAYTKFCKWYIERLHKAAQYARGIIFLGPNGIGKTSMACEIGKAAIVSGYNVRYTTVQQYVNEFKENGPAQLKEFSKVDFVLLDELDKVYMAKSSNFVPKTLEDFVRRKTSSGTTFIICTNYDIETLSEVFGKSTLSMLKRHLKFLDIEGSDYSEVLHSQWDAVMSDELDFYDKNITTMAEKLTAYEREEERGVWEKTY